MIVPAAIVREGPSTSSAVKTQFKEGTTVCVLGRGCGVGVVQHRHQPEHQTNRTGLHERGGDRGGESDADAEHHADALEYGIAAADGHERADAASKRDLDAHPDGNARSAPDEYALPDRNGDADGIGYAAVIPERVMKKEQD